MSSDPNTPDFDSMSPEEMMAWMESLAKRQGADASGFTTDASMEVAEIDPSTVDDEILNQQYIPDGWTEERWQAQLEKEEAEKQARLAAQQQAPTPEPVAPPTPEPEPEPEPAVASEPAMSDDGMPDVDSMSPEELMEWMESLAKRQGADASGFTTGASMDVAEVDPSTVDDEILNQKYIPDGWTEERWEAQLAKEEAEKQARMASQQEPQLIPEPEVDPIADIVEEEDEQLFDLPSFEGETEVAPAADNPMSWLEDLAKTDEDSQELDLPDLSGLGDDLGGLSSLAQEDDGSDPMDWLASLAGDVEEEAPAIDLGDMSSGLEGLEAFALTDDEDEGDEVDFSVSLEDVEQTNPENFLESLARLEGAPEDELSTDATTPIPDFLNFTDGDSADDLALEDILEDTQPSEELEPAWDAEDPNQIENPEAWLDALAGAANPSGGSMDVFGDDDDDYDEDEELRLQEDDGAPEAVINALNSGQDVAPEDIQGFFEDMFNKANTEYAHLDDVPVDDETEEPVDEAVAIDMPDWLQELNAGGVAEGDEEETGDDLMADVLAGLEEEAPVEAQSADDTVPLPDWLGEGAGDDTGDVIADIIADELDVAPGETAILSVGDKQIEVDPNDTWTQAFLMEDREDTAEEWYTERLSSLGVDGGVDEEEVADDFETIQMTSPPGSVSLEPATFPIEEDLPEGQAEAAPEWLTGVAGEAIDEMPDFAAMAATDEAEQIDMPDWLSDSIDDDIEIPDWLTEADSEETDDIPDWLADAGVQDVDDVPDWLTDTVEEPADFIIAEPEPEPQQSVAIQPVQAPPSIAVPPPAADVAAAIQSAKSKVESDDLDGGLADYESVVRANDGLDVVVNDLQKLTKSDKHKKNPAVYRVLGDAMMRKGDLQDALDVYRRALNLL